MEVRLLAKADYNKGFLPLLAQLTTVGDVSEEQFSARFEEMMQASCYRTYVIEDTASGQLVGTATLIVEKKFIHSCGQVGHVEDVVVDGTCRGQGLGLKLVQALVDAAKEMGCYKIILDCKEENAAFYEKSGLTRKEIQMVKYLDR